MFWVNGTTSKTENISEINCLLEHKWFNESTLAIRLTEVWKPCWYTENIRRTWDLIHCYLIIETVNIYWWTSNNNPSIIYDNQSQ